MRPERRREPRWAGRMLTRRKVSGLDSSNTKCVQERAAINLAFPVLSRFCIGIIALSYRYYPAFGRALCPPSRLPPFLKGGRGDFNLKAFTAHRGAMRLASFLLPAPCSLLLVPPIHYSPCGLTKRPHNGSGANWALTKAASQKISRELYVYGPVA